MTMKPRLPNYRRGDVLLVLFPNSDLRTAKRRPALVIQADNLHTGLPQIIVAMITSQMSRTPHVSRVVVRRESKIGKGAGLLKDSVVMTDNLATVRISIIDSRIGSLDMSEVSAALRHTLNLNQANPNEAANDEE